MLSAVASAGPHQIPSRALYDSLRSDISQPWQSNPLWKILIKMKGPKEQQEKKMSSKVQYWTMSTDMHQIIQQIWFILGATLLKQKLKVEQNSVWSKPISRTARWRDRAHCLNSERPTVVKNNSKLEPDLCVLLTMSFYRWKRPSSVQRVARYKPTGNNCFTKSWRSFLCHLLILVGSSS